MGLGLGWSVTGGLGVGLAMTLAGVCLALLVLGRTAPERIVALSFLAALAYQPPGLAPPTAATDAEGAMTSVVSDWNRLLEEMLRVGRAPLRASSGPELFDALESVVADSPIGDRLTVSVHAEDGPPLAWSPLRVDPRPDPSIDDSGAAFRIRTTLAARLLTMTVPEPDLGLRTVDVYLESLTAPSRLPPLFGTDHSERLTIAYVDTPHAAEAYARLLRDRGEPYVSRVGDETFWHFPLRGPTGRILVMVSLADSPPPPAPAPLPGLLALVLGALGIWLVGRIAFETHPPASPAILAAVCTLLLGCLLLPPDALPAWLWVAVAVAIGGLSSQQRPRVQAWTAPALGAAAGLLSSTPPRLPPTAALTTLTTDPWTEPTAVAPTVVLFGAWGVILMGLLWASVTLSTHRHRRWLSLLGLVTAALLARSDTWLLLFCGTLLLLGPWKTVGRWQRERTRLLAAMTMIGLVGLGAGIGTVASTRAAQSEMERRLSGVLREAVVDIEAHRVQILAHALGSLDEPAAIAAARPNGDAQAYTIWRLSQLGELGVDSAIGLFGPDLELWGVFASGIPPSLVTRWDETLPRGAIGRTEVLQRSTIRSAIAGQTSLAPESGFPALVRIAVATDLPSLRLSTERPFGDVVVARISDSGSTLWSSNGERLTLGSTDFDALAEGGPFSLTIGQRSYRGVAFIAGADRLVVAARSPDWLILIGHVLGASMLGFTGAFLLLTVAAFLAMVGTPRDWFSRAQIRRRSRLIFDESRRYGVVLLASLLLATLLPAQLLRLSATGIYEDRLYRRALENARAAISIAQRTTTELFWGETTLLDPDGKATVIADLNGADVDIYEGGQLIGTSRRHLVRVGLVPRLLHPAAHVAIGLNEDPLYLWKEGDKQIAAAPAVLGTPMRRGVLTMQLPSDPGHLVEDRIWMESATRATSALLLLGSVGLAVLLAHGLSQPLTLLTHGASRIQRGEFRLPPLRTFFWEISSLDSAMREMATELEQERAALLERRRYIETILDHATSGVVSLGPNGVVETTNHAARSLLPIEAGDLQQTRLETILERAPRLPVLATAWERFQRHRELRVVECDTESEPRQRLRVSFIPFASGPRQGSIIIVDDVSDVARAERMAAWAEMARAVAHEIKNPLTPIRLHVEHLSRVVANEPEVPPRVVDAARQSLSVVLEQVDTLKHIASEFSLFARPRSERLTRVDLRDLLAGVLRAYEAQESPVEVSARLPDDAAVVIGVSHDLERAFRNLLQNAFESVSTLADGGTVTLKATMEDDAISIQVEDSGPGIPDDERARIFEPYFSTKETGSGLGLALTRKIIREHDGTIELIPSDQGACFVIRLPLAGH